MSPEEVRLRANDYCPLPLNGKAPHIDGWQKITEPTEQEIRLWSRMRPAEGNTGILTARTPATDLDILDPGAADAAEQLVREFFEERGRILVRFGAHPKRAILFRTDKPFPKIVVNFESAPGAPGEKIELLCDGQQVVVAGVHPGTHHEYAWHGGSPCEAPATTCPTSTPGRPRSLSTPSQRS